MPLRECDIAKTMTEEELRDKIADLLNKPSNCKTMSNVWLEYKADQILTLIREAGWEPPERIAVMGQEIHDMLEDDLRKRGWKSPEEVKQRMKDILSEHPLSSEYESDARYTWPERWIALMGYFKS